jgi:ATP-dependent DNA helicase PIF1
MHVRLNSDQQAALEAVKRRENIFLSGPAGSGKSTLVSAIVAWASKEGLVCDVTAMTGCAALLLGSKAKTLHSWAGIGLGRGTAEALATDILKSPFAKKRWKRVDILIVDEISMMPPDLFEKLSQVGKRVRGGSLPWGGVQLILCGDFYQLPPVSKEFSANRFAFESPVWAAAKLTPVLLSRIERQTDQTFQTLLNEARVGKLSENSIAILKSRQGLNWRQQMIRPTLLFSKNADVDTINTANLAALEKPVHTFDAKTIVEKPEGDAHTEIPTGDLLERLVQRMDADSSYVPHLELCEGCQVMLTYNMSMEKGLVNGSRGVVVGFRPDGIPVVQFLHGDPVGIEAIEWVSNDSPALKRLQIPLRVAYAVTIHKSQGATLDCALVDIGSSTFECGQAYVALSRVRDLESLYVWNFQPARVKADPKVEAFYTSLNSTEPKEPAAPPSTPVEVSPISSPIMSPVCHEEIPDISLITDIAEPITEVVENDTIFQELEQPEQKECKKPVKKVKEPKLKEPKTEDTKVPKPRKPRAKKILSEASEVVESVKPKRGRKKKEPVPQVEG